MAIGYSLNETSPSRIHSDSVLISSIRSGIEGVTYDDDGSTTDVEQEFGRAF